MVRDIVKDTFFLSRKSEDAGSSDLNVVRDLTDTYMANRKRCAGMAANMIGSAKRIIAVGMGGQVIIMLNPVITSAADPYETEEGCLSLSGLRRTTRYREITVDYQDTSFRRHTGSFKGYLAQVIQHEIDHCGGILI